MRTQTIPDHINSSDSAAHSTDSAFFNDANGPSLSYERKIRLHRYAENRAKSCLGILSKSSQSLWKWQETRNGIATFKADSNWSEFVSAKATVCAKSSFPNVLKTIYDLKSTEKFKIFLRKVLGEMFLDAEVLEDLSGTGAYPSASPRHPFYNDAYKQAAIKWWAIKSGSLVTLSSDFYVLEYIGIETSGADIESCYLFQESRAEVGSHVHSSNLERSHFDALICKFERIKLNTTPTSNVSISNLSTDNVINISVAFHQRPHRFFRSNSATEMVVQFAKGLRALLENPPEPQEISVVKTSAWVRDEERPNCPICGKSFQFLRRRHHCRTCGDVICGNCSTTIRVPNISFTHNEVGKQVLSRHQPSIRMCHRCSISQHRKTTGRELNSQEEFKEWMDRTHSPANYGDVMLTTNANDLRTNSQLLRRQLSQELNTTLDGESVESGTTDSIVHPPFYQAPNNDGNTNPYQNDTHRSRSRTFDDEEEKKEDFGNNRHQYEEFDTRRSVSNSRFPQESYQSSYYLPSPLAPRRASNPAISRRMPSGLSASQRSNSDLQLNSRYPRPLPAGFDDAGRLSNEGQSLRNEAQYMRQASNTYASMTPSRRRTNEITRSFNDVMLPSELEQNYDTGAPLSSNRGNGLSTQPPRIENGAEMSLVLPKPFSPSMVGHSRPQTVNAASSWATHKNEGSALRSAIQELLAKVGGELHFLVVGFSTGFDAREIVHLLSVLAPGVPYIGGTIARGMCDENAWVSVNRHNDEGLVTLWGVNDPDGVYSVVHADYGESDAREKTFAAARAAQVRVAADVAKGEKPAFISVYCCPLLVEPAIDGIREVIHCPIVGGCSSDAPRSRDPNNSPADDSVTVTWIQISSSSSTDYTQSVRRNGGDCTEMGIAFALCYPSVETYVSWFSGYSPVGIGGEYCMGIVTNASNKTIYEIDYKPAATVYQEWLQFVADKHTDMDFSNIGFPRLGNLHPLGTTIDFLSNQLEDGVQTSASSFNSLDDSDWSKLINMTAVITGINEDGSLSTTSSIASGTTVVLMETSTQCLKAAITKMGAHAIASKKFELDEIVGCLMFLSAGVQALLGHKSMAEMVGAYRHWSGSASLMGMTTFGEIGHLPHSNDFPHYDSLMFGAIIFSNRKKNLLQ